MSEVCLNGTLGLGPGFRTTFRIIIVDDCSLHSWLWPTYILCCICLYRPKAYRLLDWRKATRNSFLKFVSNTPLCLRMKSIIQSLSLTSSWTQQFFHKVCTYLEHLPVDRFVRNSPKLVGLWKQNRNFNIGGIMYQSGQKTIPNTKLVFQLKD